MKIRLSKSSISSNEIYAVTKVLRKEYLGMGAEVNKLEQAIRSHLKTEHEVVCVNSGTAALHLALEGLGIGHGDEVLVPSLTYVACFQAISACGATPVPCDIDPKTIFLDAKDAEKRITRKTKAIMPVHYASSSIGMEAIYELASIHGLRVVEDAAQAYGSKRNNINVGRAGDVICFSFDGIKNITAGEGGAILSTDRPLINKIKDARLLGVAKDTEKRYSSDRSWEYDVFHQGYRYHMSNIMAAIALAQLERIELFRSKRSRLVDHYLTELSNISEVKFLHFNYDEIFPHIFVIKCIDRDGLREHLTNLGIETGIHYKPNHLLSRYSVPYSLPMTEAIYSQLMSLPLHYDLTTEEQAYVINSVRKFYGK